MGVSEAQLRAKKKYEDKHYWRPTLRFPKEYEEIIRKKSNGSVNGYIFDLIKKDLGIKGED